MSTQLSELGDPIATGRCAEVYAWPDEGDQVVKLFPPDYPIELVAAEQLACEEATRLGVNHLACHGRVTIEGRLGLILDRVHGESLTTTAERNPLTIRSGSRTLAVEHAKLHAAHTDRLPEVRQSAIAALDTAPLAFLTPAQRETAVALIKALPAGDSVLHLDFHTENVFAHDDGHTVIDWATALRGDPAADVAATVLLIRDAELWPGTPWLKRVAVQLIRSIVLSTYLGEYQRLTGMTSTQIDAWRVPNLILRMSTLDIASERGRMSRELVELLEDQS